MRKCICINVFLLICMTAGLAMADDIVNDTWLDGTRTDPVAPTYSEMGVDSDADGDIESAWFRGGTGTIDPVGAGGPLRITQTSASSVSLTSYFTPEGSELALSNPGDSIRLTWGFKVSGQLAANTSQGFRLAVVDSPAASRVSTDATPGSAAYTGYSLFMNMNPNTFSHNSPFDLRQRTDPLTASALLSASASWTSLGVDGTNGNASYASGVDYTFIMELTRRIDGNLDIMASMAGIGLDGTGLMQVNYTGAPNGGSYAFDTFQLRPDGYDVAWEVFDTSVFKVEFIPEPATIALLGLGLLAIRRNKK
jgi:hypothetical protein